MAYFLGVDTGGTYTDAVIVDEAADRVIGSAKSLTTRGDLALGIGRAVDAALAESGVSAAEVALVSLSTTLATNALVEGQGGRVALIFVGFDADDLDRGGLTEALIARKTASDLGLKVMVGCMVGSSLAMAPAVILAQGADYCDLDGPLLLREDRDNPLFYDAVGVHPPPQNLWG